MSRILRLLATLRVSALFFSVPYTILWADAARSGGALLVVGHAVMLLLFLAVFTARTMRAGEEPRLSIVRDHSMFDIDAAERAAFVLTALAVIVGLALLVGHFWLGVVLLLAVALIHALTRGVRPRARGLEFAELTWPAAVLIGPLTLVHLLERRAIARAVEGIEGAVAYPAMGAGVGAATLLGALAMAVFVVLCLLRDEPEDRGIGVRTTATVLGRAGTTVFLFLWMSLALVLAAWGGVNGLWSWTVPAILGVAAMAVGWFTASRIEGYAVGLWAAAHALVAIILVMTVG